MGLGSRAARRALVAASGIAALLGPAAAAGTGWVRDSVSHGGGDPDGNAFAGGVTPGGRYTAFQSAATDLLEVPGNSASDVFVRDARKGRTILVSRTPGGAEGNGTSGNPAISANGRWVLFQSNATDLGVGAGGTGSGVYVGDLRTGTVALVSIGEEGLPGNGSSFETGQTLSSNGRWAVFLSRATNLVAGVDTHGVSQVYVRDLRRGITTLVSRDREDPLSGASGSCSDAAISPEGRFVAFTSGAGNLVPGDSNGEDQVYLFDLRRGTTVRLSESGGVPGDGSCYLPVLSRGARYVAFETGARDLAPGQASPDPDILLADTRSGTLRNLTPTAGAGECYGASISSSGRTVVFTSGRDDLVEGDGNGVADVFRLDLRTGLLDRLTVNDLGVEANGRTETLGSSLSSNGKWLVVNSIADNLAPGTGDDGRWDFLRMRVK